jgi:pregnancy-associated plasma protein-A/type IX secretion system substrate protein
MIRYILLFVVTGLFSAHVLSQESCVSSRYNLLQLKANPQMAERQRAIAAFLTPTDAQIRTLGTGDDPTAQTVIKIPVVVHVIYNSKVQNITDAQIESQVEIMNRDFRRHNADSVNTPSHFRPFAADCNIEFVLATRNPQGGATNGIVRKPTSVFGFSMDDDVKFSSKGGDDAWDSDRYLNVWVAPMSAGIVGYASAPGGEKNRDGVVIRFNAFGSTGAAAAPYNHGRTAVHEVGHWLALNHIWGDQFCGDDLVDDTPTQSNFTSGCPSGKIVISCSNGPNGDMYMNYMDLTEDACTNLFTSGQKARMRKLFDDGGPRHALLSSTAAEGTVVPPPVNIPLDPANDGKIRMYPNPAKSDVTLDFGGDLTVIGQYVSVFNQYGQMITFKVIAGDKMTLNIGSLATGVYFVKVGNDKKTLRLLKTAY